MKTQTKLLCVWLTDQSSKVIKSKEETVHTDSNSWVHGKTLDEIYAADAQFSWYNKTRFKANVKSLQRKIRNDKEAVLFDGQALSRVRILQPVKMITDRGEVRYEGSKMEEQLKEEVENGLSAGLPPDHIVEKSINQRSNKRSYKKVPQVPQKGPTDGP